MNIIKSTFCAHRGASGNFPENTMRAFNAALALGVSWIETDLNLSSDEKLVIFHDTNLGRTISGSVALSSLTLEEIQSLDAGSWKGKEFSNEKVLSFQQLSTTNIIMIMNQQQKMVQKDNPYISPALSPMVVK